MKLTTVALLGSLLASPALAHAQGVDPAPDADPAADPAAALVAPEAATTIVVKADPKEAADWQRAHFSGGRWVVEMLVGALVGSLSAVAAYNLAGGDVGGAIAGTITSFVTTPLAEWGVGNLMGGRGTLGWAYTGGLIGFSAATPAAPNGALLTLVIAEICLPITSGLLYEFSSSARARNWENAHGLGVSLTPLPGTNGGVGGAALSAGLRF